MDKIDWNDKSIPDWANYAAMDANGSIYVFRKTPVMRTNNWWSIDGYHKHIGKGNSAGWKESLQERIEMKMDEKTLTFGELCEAIAHGKELQYLDGDTWKDNHLLTDKREIRSIVYYANKDKYRIKPEQVKCWQFIIQSYDGYTITLDKYTQAEANRKWAGMVFEPYLPSEEPVNA